MKVNQKIINLGIKETKGLLYRRKVPRKEARIGPSPKKEDQKQEIDYNDHLFSQTESIMNITDNSSESGSSSSEFANIASDMQISSLSRQTPDSIKKLFVGIIAVLLGAIVLISI